MNTELEIAINALLEFRLVDWQGLPSSTTLELTQRLGVPADTFNTYIGMQSAIAMKFPMNSFPALGLIAYLRGNQVLALETFNPPPASVLSVLGPPDIRKPGEFLLAGYLIHEYVFCKRGLALSVADALPSEPKTAIKIVRCRGIASLASPSEFDARYYLAQQSRRVFDTNIEGS